MNSTLLVPGLVVAALGLVVFLVPESVWRAMTSPGGRMREQASVAGLLLFLGVTILGTGLVIGGIRDTLRGRASTAWIPTPATIVALSLEESREARSGRKLRTPSMTYRYEIAGVAYEGRRLSFGSTAFPASEGGAEAIAARYAVGTQHSVFVNRANPDDAVLFAGADPLMLVFAGVGLVLALVGAHQLRMLANNWAPDDTITISEADL